MSIERNIAAAVQIGRQQAERTLTRRRAVRAGRARALEAHPAPLEFNVQVTSAAGLQQSAAWKSAGFLVALGDSWFDYPFHDVLERLDELGYNIEDSAHRGDRLESMAYDDGQIDQFAQCLEKVIAHGAVPKAVLISGGGNDIVGDDFGMLLNSAASPIQGLNEQILEGIIGQRIFTSYHNLFSAINAICQDYLHQVLPIVVHGYDYLIPDGRGILFGWPLPGPWLKPGFNEKGFDDLPTNRLFMIDLINRLNQMLSTLNTATTLSNIYYLDLRGTLNSDLTGDAYKQSWSNELHPTKDGFEAIAKRFADLIATF